MEKIKVSVLCLVYNHEKYLRKCLDSFIMQETNFAYEVLIHDDASIDNSADIIREYEYKYPNIIKPIYQTENQYSQGVDVSKTFLYPRAQGKYIAFCEGDDCWTSPHKLQRQYDYMEKNEKVGLCVHEAVWHNISDDSFGFVTREKKERNYSVDEVIEAGGGLFATNSLFIRRNNLLSMPDCFQMKGMGDFQLVVYNTICGGCHYIPHTMSQYNMNVSGSFTDRHKSDLQMRINFCVEKLEMLKKVDKYYNYAYTKSFQKNASVTEAYLEKYIELKENDNNLENGEVQIVHVGRSQKVKNMLKESFPWIAKLKSKLRSKKALYAIRKGAK